jgi:hypothetical protein
MANAEIAGSFELPYTRPSCKVRLFRLKATYGTATPCVSLPRMDKAGFDERAKRLRQVSAVIGDLDPTIRPDAWQMLKDFVTGGASPVTKPGGGEGDKGASPPGAGSPPADVQALVDKFESHADIENALLVLAIIFMQHGRGPFTTSLVKSIATEHNLPIPQRVDVSFRNIKRDGSDLLRKGADGRWKITPAGENWIKGTYSIKRGSAPIATP